MGKVIRERDIAYMTIRQLGELAAQVRGAKPGTRRAKEAANRMTIAAAYLEDSGAMAQLLWWVQGEVEPEAPPGAKAEVVEFKKTEPGPLFLV